MDKYCYICGKLKPYKEFYSDYSGCKSCRSAYSRDHNRTKIGMIKLMYRTQVKSSIDRGHKYPEYTQQEFIDWLMAKSKFHELYTCWREADFKADLKPSVDRKDDSKGYSFENIGLTTWRVNRLKETKKQKKQVLQLSITGEVLNEFESVSAAARSVGSSVSPISKACKSGCRTVKGFKWCYKKV